MEVDGAEVEGEEVEGAVEGAEVEGALEGAEVEGAEVEGAAVGARVLQTDMLSRVYRMSGQGVHPEKLGSPHHQQKFEQPATLAVSQLDRSWVNSSAPTNMLAMLITCAVEVKFTVEAKLEALANMLTMLVTLEVFSATG